MLYFSFSEKKILYKIFENIVTSQRRILHVRYMSFDVKYSMVIVLRECYIFETFKLLNDTFLLITLQIQQTTFNIARISNIYE